MIAFCRHYAQFHGTAEPKTADAFLKLSLLPTKTARFTRFNHVLAKKSIFLFYILAKI